MLLIGNGRVITRDPERPYLKNGAVVTEGGRIAAVGPHEELYETCPGYRKMVDLQKLEEEGGADHA